MFLWNLPHFTWLTSGMPLGGSKSLFLPYISSKEDYLEGSSTLLDLYQKHPLSHWLETIVFGFGTTIVHDQVVN